MSAQHVSVAAPKTLHDLQLEVQSFGPGPYTPEQQQKINQLNVLYRKAKEETAKYMNRPPGSSPPLVIMSSPSSTPIQVQTSSTGQQVVMSTANLRGVSPVLPQGAVVMQQALPTSSLASQVQTNNAISQSPSKVTIISNNQKGSSSLSQLSLLAQHPQGHSTPATSQIHIKPSTTTVTLNSTSKQGMLQRQVLPVQTLPGGHNQVRMVASIPGHQSTAGQILTTVNIPASPQKHTTTTQRPIAPHGISVQQSPQTPMVIQVSAAGAPQGKSTLVATTAVRNSAPPALIPQASSNENLKAPLSAAPKVAQQMNISQGLHSTEPISTEPQKVLSRKRIQELLQEVDPRATLDEDVEDLLLQIADDFIESVVNASCQIARHRKSSVLDVRDIQLHLERNWNMWIPGYGTEDFKQSKKLGSTEAHKQRLALIRKSMKK